MKEPMYVAFSTQKGGAGKTTLTVLVASYLHYLKGCNVAVVDCDYPQHSIAEMRKRDMQMCLTDDHYKAMAHEQFARLGKRAYDVLESTPEGALEKAQQLIDTGIELDYIFFDLPGTINNAGVVRTLGSMDYIFTPISADRVVLESSLRYANVLNDTMISTGRSKIKGLYMLWNIVDGREKSELYAQYEEVIHRLGINILKTFMPDSKRFRKEATAGHKPLFRSTLFPAERSQVKGSNLEELAEEILGIINGE
ncbi:ParA family protein [Bacteroides thetaiotaomicron]|uniref:ParA family protein n=1 Tax=Bacteroides thetaiotaomicron TaxID=818 RepID=UPI001C8C8167|nr:ParA family protein [Bacteroides thetaiotaomicron]MBX9049620.1 ParA family protein [Bacteroides thetaiotaomicron]MBX9072954.1 ParA family protein [Bacteroides thetaiotaomicron]